MRKITYMAAGLAAWALLFALLNFLKNGHIERYLDEQAAMQNLAWEAAARMNQGTVRTYFHEYVMRPQTLEILNRAQDPARRANARAQLHHALDAVNRELQNEGFRQFHFHLPGGESLLRFHQPDAHGDNLFGVRYSVKTANTELRPVFGFEAGRVYSGFRSVFPIVDPQYGHLGSVELSMPFEALRKEISQLLPDWEFLFVVSGKQHERVLFDRQKSLYVPWVVHGGFWLEDPWRILPDSPKPVSDVAGCMVEGAANNPQVRALLESGQSGAVAVPVKNGDHALMLLTAVRDTQGELAGYLVGVRPTHEIVRFNWSLYYGLVIGAVLIVFLGLAIWHLSANRRHLQETNAKLDRALAAEKQFIASMSHEMRTPLNSVMGYLELLLDVGLRGQALEFAQKASRSAHHLFALINDILDLSKLEADQLELNNEPTDVAVLMRECADMIAPALKPGVDLRVEVCSVCCSPVLDAMRLRQIFINLLGNAAKFTHRGHIRFFCEADNKEASRIRIKFGVEDTGTGIDPQKMSELFKPFRRAHGRQYEGTGLGLYLSRALAERLGGTLEARSTPGEGSCFTVTIDIECCPERSVSMDGRRPAVLLIEEEPLAAEVARTLFAEAFDLAIEVAGSEEQALARLSAGGVDLVLLDMENPAINAPSLVRAVRAFNPDTPIAAVATAPFVQTGGIDAVLTKPLQKEPLARLLERVKGL
ncbi:MAG: ATP-binding protein [Campylobacterales bacterium]